MINRFLNDYRDDWVKRALDVKGVKPSAFDGKTIYTLIEKDSLICETLRGIFEGLCARYGIKTRLVCSDGKAALPDGSIVITAQREVSGGGLACPDGCEEFCICINGGVKKSARVLYCGGLYGAGAELDGMRAEENDCTSFLDMFGGLMFLIANRAELENGVYYAGHGKPAIPAALLSDKGYVPMISCEDGRYMLDFYNGRPNERFYFDNTYNGKLALLQSLLIKLLEEFDRICKKHGIKYFLGGGTLLGAVRHDGIIPWDDDIDVMMLRGEYEKFLTAIKSESGGKFFFQSADTDPQYHSVFTKLRLKGTKFVTRFSSQFEDMEQGIFIDIFVHDKTAKSPLMQRWHIFRTLLARSAVFHKWAGTPMHFYGKLKWLCSLATAYIKRTDIKKLEKKQEKVIRRYEKKNTGFLYDGTGEHLRHGAFPEEWLKGERYALFGGKYYPIPAKAEEYLEYSYRNYNEWIPASLRKAGHDIVEVDFGEYDDLPAAFRQ